MEFKNVIQLNSMTYQNNKELSLQKKELTSRSISQATQLMLWGITAGRCEFDGCNKPLWQSSITKEQVNIAQKAHIWSFSENGPRGNDGIDLKKINSLCNLMLVCHECHKLIDEDKKGEKYSVELLIQMKQKHEDRINLATSISPNKDSHIILYGSNIGNHNPLLNYKEAAEAIFPDYYPADNKAFELGITGSPFSDNEANFWMIEKNVLDRNFNKLIKPLLVTGEIKHLSIFAIAPQPLLIFLGTLLSDIPATHLYQRIREPQTWCWQNDAEDITFEVKRPEINQATIVLNLSLSATIDDSRIHEVLGTNVSIWILTIPNPNNDFLRSSTQLALFRQAFRLLMDQIKSRHGQNQILHVFPAVPVSIAVEIGRIFMPKADMQLKIYDQNRTSGFQFALDVPEIKDIENV